MSDEVDAGSTGAATVAVPAPPAPGSDETAATRTAPAAPVAATTDTAGPAQPAAPSTVGRAAARPRLYSLDALRGIAVALMIVVDWAGTSGLPPTFAHAEWHGLTLADVVFPTFLVAVGAAMPLSSRTGWRRAWGRAAMLYLIGSALSSFKYHTEFALTPGVIQLIGVVYILTWLVLQLPRRVQTPVVVAALAGVSLAYLYLAPAEGVVPGSFEPDTTIGEWFDWRLGMAPHPEAAHAWLPAVGSAWVGVLAGRICIALSGGPRRLRLGALGSGLLLAGLLLQLVIPVNKYLWTPSFVLVTGGIAVLCLVVLDLLIPASSRGGVFRPLVLIGGHPIVVFAYSETLVGRARDEWLWPDLEPGVTDAVGSLWAGAIFPLAAIAVGVLLAWVMERAGIRIRV